MKRLLIVGALLVATPAAAQTTSCRQNGNQVMCNTTPGMDQSAGYPTAHFSSGSHASASDCANGVGVKPWAISPAQKRCKDIYKRSQSIGPMIAEGRCDEARQAALRAGDLGLAEQVQTLCTPRP